MSTLPERLYWAAIRADAAFSRELSRCYGERAGDARYAPTSEHSDPEVLRTLREKLAADAAYQKELDR